MSGNSSRDTISRGQYFALLVGVMVGTGILNMSRTISLVSRQDAWISVISAGFAVFFNMLILTALAKRFPRKTLVEYSQDILGKWLGRAVTVVFILFHTANSALVLRLMGSLIETWFLPRTPSGVILIVGLAATVYIARNGLVVLGRYSVFMFVLLLPFIILIFPPVLRKPSFVNLLPIGGTGIVTILKGMLPAVYAFIGYEVILMFYPFLGDKKKALKTSLGAAVFTTSLYTLVVAAQLVVYSYEELRFMLYPLMRYINFIEVPILERVESIFIYFWVFAIINTIAVQYYTATLQIGRLFRLKDRKNISFYIAPAVYIAAQYPDNIAEIIEIIGYISQIGLVLILGVPLFMLMIALIRGLKEEDNESSKA